MNNTGKFLRFQLERWLQRGVFHQLTFMAAVIATISIIGGLIAWWGTDQFGDPLDAIWWSFLRLTDPGYLGDDEGAVLRVVSTVVTVLGYVMFMGSLIAIMTQWLHDTLQRFESGLSPITMRGHVVILGWTSRTPEIISQLLSAKGRLCRFLEAHEQRRLRIVVMADEVNAERRYRLRRFLADRGGDKQVYLRGGSSLKPGDLERFDLARAAAVIVPGDEFGYQDSETSDARVVKTLLNLRPILDVLPGESRPTVVAEIFDPPKERAARRALEGRVEVVPSDAVIGRLVAQTIRDVRLAPVFFELLSHHRGCAPYLRGFPELAGRHPIEVDGLFDEAVVIGAVRNEGGRSVTHLNPASDFRLNRDDLLVMIARTYEDCSVTRQAEEQGAHEPVSLPPAPGSSEKRVLVLGWSYKIVTVLEELAKSDTARFEITVVSRQSKVEREALLKGISRNPGQLRIEHVEEDQAAFSVLEALDVASFDSTLLMASSSNPTADEADARTILTYEVLKSVLDDRLPDDSTGPEIIVEIVHPATNTLFADPRDVVLLTSKILGFLQTHVALREELNSVFGEMFATGGAEVMVRSAGDYAFVGRTVSYRDVERMAMSHGEVALGILVENGAPSGRLELCPPPERPWAPDDGSSIVVLAAGGGNV